jgi:hypothetical protein
MGTATVASGGDGTKTVFPFTPTLVPVAAQPVSVTHSREAFTADFADFTEKDFAFCILHSAFRTSASICVHLRETPDSVVLRSSFVPFVPFCGNTIPNAHP